MANEKLFHVGVKALIKNDKGRVLLFLEDVTTHSIPTDPYWDIAGGRIQGEESAVDTLRREIEEETGLTDISEPVFKTAVISNHRIKLNKDILLGLVLMIYEVSIPVDVVIKLSDEHTAYEWVDVAEAKKRLADKYPKEFTDLL